jgi:hypothetical protein
MFFPSTCTNAEQRNRLSSGSEDAQTAQGHAITGMPCDVPVPKKMTVILLILLILLIT